MKKLIAIALTLIMVLSMTAFTWPEENVTVLIPATAGGQSDLLARIVCGKLQEITGKTFTVVNDDTGAGSVAYETIRTAEPDGYTLGVQSTSIFAQMATGNYEATMDDFTWLNYVNDPGIESAVICVRADSPFQTIEELIDYAKEHPGELQTGVSIGNSAHLVEIITDAQFGIEIEYLQAGTNAARTPLFVGGQFDLMMASTAYLYPYVESGDLRPLVVTGAQRSALYPDVPSMTELGYESTEQPMVWSFFGPAGLSDEFIENFDALMEQAMNDEDVQEQIEAMKLTATYANHEDTDELVHSVYDAFSEAFALLNGSAEE